LLKATKSVKKKTKQKRQKRQQRIRNRKGHFIVVGSTGVEQIAESRASSTALKKGRIKGVGIAAVSVTPQRRENYNKRVVIAGLIWKFYSESWPNFIYI
jgi:hypothetical protein